MNTFKNIGFLSAFSLFAMSLAGCQGTVVVAPYPHCDSEPVQVCHTYVDYRGQWHRECGIEYRRHCWDVAQSPVGAVTLGNEYGLSFKAADRLISTAVDANNGKLDSATKLGLTQADIEKMANQELPTDEGIESVARNLDQDPSSVRDVFTGIMSETHARLQHVR